jgi:hypothetical protein
MGREIRMVPANWEHPKNSEGDYKPMFMIYYEDVLDEWIENHYLWLKKEHPDQKEYSETKNYKYYAEWVGSPPDIEEYLIEKEPLVWVQMFENISEGTPLSPSFETKKELIKWLSENKNYWDEGPMPYEGAKKFVEQGYCSSFIIQNNKIRKCIDNFK